jgi:LPS export ABC transporter protein LptC
VRKVKGKRASFKDKFIRKNICLLVFGLLFSCVNDLDSIKKVTFRSDAPDDVTENLKILQTDGGLAQFQLFARLAETYSKPQAITKLKDGMKVNFFSESGEIVSTLTALYGEFNISKGTFYVKDSVRLHNYEKEQTMETEELLWNQKDSSVTTQKEVIVRNAQGVLFGKGIRTKQDFSTYVFMKPTGKIDFDKK